MEIKRPLIWVIIIIAIVVIGYCAIYTGGIMMSPRM